MRPMTKILASLFAAAAIPAAYAATVGGANYAVQYDYRELYQVAQAGKFQVIVAGSPFPAMDEREVSQRLLPQMQANRGRIPFTFTYDAPAEEPHPYYRLVLVFDPANDFGSARACNSKPQFKPNTPGRVYVFAVYCRNDIAMSETTAWTEASGPDDPRVGELFKDLFRTVFSDSVGLYPQHRNSQFN